MMDRLKAHYPVERLCEALGCPRSRYYYPSSEGNDEALKSAIERIVGRWPFYGYRRVTAGQQQSGAPGDEPDGAQRQDGTGQSAGYHPE